MATVTGSLRKNSITLDDIQAGSFSGNGANLTSLNATSISSGTLANARLPDLTVSDFAGSAIQTGSESFSDSDTALMTAAAVQDKILSYDYTSYSHPTGAGNEHLPATVSQTEAGYLDGVTSAIQTQLDGKVDDSQVLTNVPSGAVFTDTVYSKPASEPISYVSGLQSALDGKTTEGYVDAKITNLVGSAPANLNTLQELGDALSDDANFASTVTNSLSGKVDKVTGKALSTNDYTTTEKNKLSGIATSANNYSHPTGVGSNHIPTGGATGQYLKYSSSGVAVWAAGDTAAQVLTKIKTVDGSGSGLDADKLDGVDSTGFQRQIDEVTVNLASPAATFGTWNTYDADDWGTPRIGTSVARYNTDAGYLQFNVPAGMDTAYLSQLCWHNGGYADIYGVQSDGGLVFLRRINTRQNIENANEGANGGNNNQHDGSTITLAASGLSYFSAIRIQNRTGNFHLTGLGFTSAKLHGAEGVGLVHPQQLSTQGSGSGLDADLLDGVQGSSFLRSDADDTVNAGVTYTWTATNTPGLKFTNTSYAKSLEIGGWTTANTAGVSRIRNSNDNLHIDAGSGGHVYLNNYCTGNTYIRGQIAWHAGNDGSGSGLDADLLDGQHASAFATSGHTHNSLAQVDTRNTTTTPQTTNSGLKIDFKSNTSNGLSDGGSYFGLLTYRQYGAGTDWSGGKSHQLGFTDNDNIWQRSGTGTTWGSWKKMLDSSNYNSYAPTKTGTGASGTWGISVTGNAETATRLASVANHTTNNVEYSPVWENNANTLYTSTANYTYNPSLGRLTAKAFKSTVATGTAPLTVTSTTKVTNLNADLLDGYHASTTRNSANTIPIRNSSGYLDLGWINTTSGNTTTASSDYYVNTNDGYIRKKTLANVKTEIVTKAAIEASLTGAITSHTHSYLPLTGGALTGDITITSGDSALWTIDNGTGSSWRGRLGTKNSTANKATFLGTYNSKAVIAAHNNALTAWTDLYINTVDGLTGGTVRLPTGTLINGSTAWHAGNDGSGSGLDADLLDGYHKQQIMPYQSGNDFTNGTLVTTSIASGATSGDSFVIEISGKAYGASRPHKVIAEGYIYNNTIINTNGSNLGGSNFTSLKVMNINGNLSFWWPRHGYWNSYNVFVRSSSTSSDNRNKVTSIANSADPVGATKKIQIDLGMTWTSHTDGSGSGLDADLLDGQHGSYYLNYNNFTNTPTIPSLSGYATELYVGAQISNLVDSSPTALNTLNELAAALGDDANFSTTVTNSIATKMPLAGGTLTGALTISGSATRGTYTSASQYHSGADNLILKGNSSGISSIFFESEKNGTNINHTSDFGFIQYHPYGTGSAGEANELIIGVSNDADDHIILNAPNANGIKMRVGASATDYTIWHSGNDGAGSGLDADTLDNISSGSFLRSDVSDTVAAGRQISFYSHDNIESSSGDQASLEVYQDTVGADAFMQFHVGGDYAAYFGIDGSTNDFSVGGWSMGANKYRVWHAGNDGAGSGLDADLLDGQQGSYYNQSQYKGSSFTSRNSGNVLSVDSATENMAGYTNNSSAAGYADGGLFVAAYSTSWVSQIFSNFRDGHLSVRGKNNGTWQPWYKVWDSGNDGSGSGLDADKLDGQHASAFATSGHSHSYLPLSGGTMTGNTLVNNYGLGLVGKYSATRYQNVFSMGNSYKLTADGTGVGTMYGIAWTHTNISGQSKTGLAHQALFMTNGVTQTAIGTGIWTLGTITEASDKRLKENIEPLKGSLNKVLQLQGVSYNKIETPDKKEIGFIAQDVQEVISELVEGSDDTSDEEMLSVSYARTVALLVEAMKEQSEIINDLNDRILILEEK